MGGVEGASLSPGKDEAAGGGEDVQLGAPSPVGEGDATEHEVAHLPAVAALTTVLWARRIVGASHIIIIIIIIIIVISLKQCIRTVYA